MRTESPTRCSTRPTPPGRRCAARATGRSPRGLARRSRRRTTALPPSTSLVLATATQLALETGAPRRRGGVTSPPVSTQSVVQRTLRSTIRSTGPTRRPKSTESANAELSRACQRRERPSPSGPTPAWRTPRTRESSAILRFSTQPFSQHFSHALQLGLAQPLVRHHLREHPLGRTLEDRIADAS